MGDQRAGGGADDDNKNGQESYRHIFRRLTALNQAPYHTMQEAADRLSQEIQALTDCRASLILSSQKATSGSEQGQWTLSLPVCFYEKCYGKLQIMCVDGQPALPALPDSVTPLLAELCGWLLYTWEITTWLQQFREQFVPAAREPLTKREAQVLALMEQRLSDLLIAQSLFITVTTVHTYQRTIYSKLGVHGKLEAILVGWLQGLFSPRMETQL